MKRIIPFMLVAALLLSMTGCRRRIAASADETRRETYREEVPDPGQPGEETVYAGKPEENGAPDPEFDPTAPPVDKETPAEGGEQVEHTPNPPKAGKTVTVSLDPSGGECAVGTITAKVGAVYGTLPVPIRGGYTFMGWFTQETAGIPVDAATVVTIREDHTLYARWSEFRGYTVTFDPSGGRLSAYRAEKKVYPGETYGELPTPYYDGYTFDGWFTEPQGGVRITEETPAVIHQDQTLYAQWTYAPYDYWSFVLENTTQRIYACQETWVYLELEAEGVTQRESRLIRDAGSQNIAQNVESSHVTDSWVAERNPDVIVKITSGGGSPEAAREAVESRFPGTRVYVFPAAAIGGTDGEKLYYALKLAAILYPEYYYTVDWNTAARELGVEDGTRPSA